MSSFSDRLATKKQFRKCSVGLAIDALRETDPEDAEALVAAIDDDDVPDTRIEKAVRYDAELPISRQHIIKHRGRNAEGARRCGCPG